MNRIRSYNCYLKNTEYEGTRKWSWPAYADVQERVIQQTLSIDIYQATHIRQAPSPPEYRGYSKEK